MKSILGILLVAVGTITISGVACTPESEVSTVWTETSSEVVKGQPNIVETVWETQRALAGKYNTVGVRRLKATGGGRTSAVIVYLPPSVTSARLYTSSENHDFRLFLANRGYDIYSVDYRPSFVSAAESDLSFMATWDTKMFLDDIKASVALAKEKSGSDKVFIAGHSTGARYVYVYSALRWREELIGIIVMDGAPWESSGPDELYTADIGDIRCALAQGDTPANRTLFKRWNLTPGSHYYEVGAVADFAPEFSEAVSRYFREGPDAPISVSGFATVKDFIAWQFHNLWGPREFSNVLGGYATVDMLLNFVLKASDDYWPIAEYADDAYIGNWNGKTPESELNFLSQIGEIDIPLIVFASGEWQSALGMQSWWKNLGPVLVKTTNTEFHLLKGFGHIDVLLGERARIEVFEPLLDWLSRNTR